MVNEIDLVKDSTMQDIAYAVRKMAGLTEQMPANFAEIKKLVQTGNARKIFSVGDQIFVNWTDRVTDKQYSVPLNVVHHGTATLKTGEEVPAMYLRWG